MQIGPDGVFHLTYGTKIHPGRGWEELLGNLRACVPPLKARLAPQQPFGLGLRLSNAESAELLGGDNLPQFQAFLAQNGLYVFTLNGFPYGALDGPTVKSEIFAPDWREEERLTYTLRLVEILRRLLPPGVEGSISTMPLSYKPWIAAGDTGAWTQITRNLVRLTVKLMALREQGVLIHLDLEPEPDGLLERSGEVVDFYEQWLLPVGGPLLAEAMGSSRAEAHQRLREHIQVCLDTCHLAVEFEDPVAALAAWAAHGIRVGKLQITSGLKVTLPAAAEDRAGLARQLEPFTRSPYLHQVIAQGADGRRTQFRDLAEALPGLAAAPDRQWRIHYHMPLFVDRYQMLDSTHDDTRTCLALLKEQRFTRHLEIETYTWEWLPPGLKADLLESLHREYLWVLDALGM